MRAIQYKGITIYMRFFAPGIIRYYGTCCPMPMQFRACKTKEEAYEQYFVLEGFAKNEQKKLEEFKRSSPQG